MPNGLFVITANSANLAMGAGVINAPQTVQTFACLNSFVSIATSPGINTST